MWDTMHNTGEPQDAERRTQNAKRRTPTATKLPYKMVVKSNTFYLPLFLFAPRFCHHPQFPTHPVSRLFVFTRTSCFSFASECPLYDPRSSVIPPSQCGSGLRLSLHVQPPFWLTSWFFDLHLHLDGKENGDCSLCTPLKLDAFQQYSITLVYNF